MFHIGRSGSTVVADMLRRHPGIFWDGEVYERYFQAWVKTNNRLFLSGSEDCPLDAIGEVGTRLAVSDKPWYGFEVKFFHLQHGKIGLKEYVGALREMGFSRFVVLERRNYLRKVVSGMIASKSGIWHLGSDSLLDNPVRRVRLNPAAIKMDRQVQPLLTLLEGYRRGFAELSAVLAPEETLWLTYEDDVMEDPMRAYLRIVDHFGLARRPAVPRFRRTTPVRLEQALENLEKIRACLAGTDFAWMAEEAGSP